MLVDKMKEPKKQRNKRFPVMMTDSEYRRFNRLADKRHTTLSDLLRQLAHREADLEDKKEAAA
jgi:molybdopterin/thiamine biosynthesis adenylyltransferase